MIRKGLRAVGVTLLTAVLVWAVVMLFSPYLRRWTLLMQPDVHDYSRLPSRTVPRSAHAFHFPDGTSGDWIAPLKFTYQNQTIANEEELGRFLGAHGTTAFIVIKDGRLIDEKYFRGFQRDSLFKSFSVTKSVLSAMIGQAIADGLIGSPDDPVTKYVPEMKDSRFRRVTLRHCLDNTAGVKYTRGAAPWAGQPRMYYTLDVRGYAERAKLASEPGTQFVPEDLSPIILGLVLERALQKHPSANTLAAYLSEQLWQPIGAEYDAVWNVDTAEGGLEKAESGLSARAIDLAKFASLYLDDGRWGGTQLVPSAWVVESTTIGKDEHAPNVWEQGFHKHLWWGRKVPGTARPDFYANGHFGQRLYVSPRNHLVLVRMGEANEGIDWADFLGAVADAFARQGASAVAKE
jgi:CubicO group peptidase (beta-lactamase class C family)